MDLATKSFIREHFDFSALKKVGFFPKEMKATNYEGQAKRICDFFGYESVFEYGKNEIRCHITYGGDDPASISSKRPPMKIDSDGELSYTPFVEIFFPNQLHI